MHHQLQKMTSLLTGFLLSVALAACGGGGSPVTKSNVAPTAQIANVPDLQIGTPVTIDGSPSTDPDGDIITYHWKLLKPENSKAILSADDSPKPTFTPDVPGNYVAILIVNDGFLESGSFAAHMFTSPTKIESNSSPTANAGMEKNVLAGANIQTLDGTSSTDPNGLPLTYKWSFISVPSGSVSQPFVSGQMSAKAQFFANVPGTYIASLIVSNGTLESLPSTVKVIASRQNSAPIAKPQGGQTVFVGSTALLDGNGSSDANNDVLSYHWTLASRPEGSTSVLMNPMTANPTIIADTAGNYGINLVVSDGTMDSEVANITIAAITPSQNKKIGTNYLATNGMTVNLLAFSRADLGNGYTRYTATYQQENTSTTAINEATLQLYSSNSSPARQYGSFGQVLPGPTFAITRTYTWDLPSTVNPLTLEYHENHFFASSPVAGSLQWLFPIT